jgi:hypothetical protein
MIHYKTLLHHTKRRYFPMECPVCLEETKPVFLPCSHHVCDACFPKLRKHTCPICRANYDEIIPEINIISGPSHADLDESMMLTTYVRHFLHTVSRFREKIDHQSQRMNAWNDLRRHDFRQTNEITERIVELMNLLKESTNDVEESAQLIWDHACNNSRQITREIGNQSDTHTH